jgi:hypothetical protein
MERWRRLAMLWVGGCLGTGVAGAQTTAYDFGAPDAAEQMMIEYVNRSRMAPAAEAQGYRDAADPAKRAPDQLDWNLADAYASYGVHMGVAVQRISALPAVPPLAPNAKLMAAARQHTQWMFANKVQSHTQPPATSPADSIVRRIAGTGYNWAGLAENIYAYGRDLYYTHASYEVDWGGPDYGMQSPAGHRLNNHNKDYRELGVGVRLGVSGYGSNDVGPVVNTVDFGAQRSSPAFVTGVVYYDVNGNQRYDLGEGVSGVRVDVAGATQHAVTAPGGGYVVPVPATAAARPVTLSGLHASGQGMAMIVEGKNVKLDFAPAYQAPVVTDPGPGVVGQPMTLSFPTTAGATDYDVVVAGLMPAALEPADAATDFITYVTPGRYSPVQSNVRVGSNGGAIHLAHPQPEDQWVMLKPTFVPGTQGSVSFQSWLRGSSPRQVARVQVSLDDGQNWSDVWTRVGTANGAAGWSTVTVPLAAHAGRWVRLRFNYTIKGDTWQAGLGTTSGWFIDDISFQGTEQLVGPQTVTVAAQGASASAAHTPAGGGDYWAAVRPVISGRRWAFAPARRLSVATTSPYVQWALAEESRLGLPPGSLATQGESPSGPDGVPALVRYAVGLAADQMAASRLPQPQPSPTGLCVVYFRDLARTDVEVRLQVSGDYLTWFDAGAPGAPLILDDSVLDVTGTVERRCAVIAPAAGRVAARLRVTPR